MQFRTLYGERLRVQVSIDSSKPEEARVKQSFKDQTDINRIMAKYKRTGQLPALVAKNPIYGDFSQPVDLMSAYAVVERAETAFAALPAAVRAECFNDPAVFLERVRDKEFQEKHKLALPKVAAPSEGVPAAGTETP